MRLIKGLIMGVGVVGILVLLFLVTGLYLYSLSPSILARAVPVAVTADAAQSFDKKLDTANSQIKAAIEAGQKKEVTLTITESEANSKLVQMLAEGQLPLKRGLINLGDGSFLTYAVVEAPVMDAKTGTVGRITITDGKPKVVIDEFNLGKLPLPQSATVRAEQLANLLLSSQIAGVPLDITSVQIADHQITIIGTTRTGE
jgi:Na+-transporting methylmalonyl-CoA/oxaloacetate decarboxylase gamma subunit